jgi:hypothetical protein
VMHVEQIFEGDAQPHGSTHRGEFEPESHTGRNVILLVVVVLAIVLVIVYWGRIKSIFG